MELKINSIIKAHTKVSYAIESAGPRPYDIDCAEGTNIVSYSPSAEEAFNELKFEMLRSYPHSLTVKDSVIHYWKDYADLNYKNITLCDGSISGLYLINRLFLENGDHVLGYVPTFSDYVADVAMHGCTFDFVTLKPEIIINSVLRTYWKN
ncbi:MAG: aminotransferase class I/II-fold pyridoxal phosphate-dependent enzyme [Anaerotignum sp.]|nr:aminotransferase class I/II-fold pyridoxal phosphate-dependent enzyme [Anaerotignum sp.]